MQLKVVPDADITGKDHCGIMLYDDTSASVPDPRPTSEVGLPDEPSHSEQWPSDEPSGLPAAVPFPLMASQGRDFDVLEAIEDGEKAADVLSRWRLAENSSARLVFGCRRPS